MAEALVECTWHRTRTPTASCVRPCCKHRSPLTPSQAQRQFYTAKGTAISVIPLETWTDPKIPPPEEAVAALAPQFEAMREGIELFQT